MSWTGTITPANVRRGLYLASWNGVELGGFDLVDFKIKIKKKGRFIGSLGDMKLDDIIDGLADDAAVSITLKEPTRARIEALSPWSATGTLLEGMPKVGQGLLQYAQPLVFHPNDVSLTALTEDLTFFKTVPDPATVQPRNRDGKTDDVLIVDFLIYPDITKLTANPVKNPYWTFGA